MKKLLTASTGHGKAYDLPLNLSDLRQNQKSTRVACPLETLLQEVLQWIAFTRRETGQEDDKVGHDTKGYGGRLGDAVCDIKVEAKEPGVERFYTEQVFITISDQRRRSWLKKYEGVKHARNVRRRDHIALTVSLSLHRLVIVSGYSPKGMLSAKLTSF
jgi:hypothetical protein